MFHDRQSGLRHTLALITLAFLLMAMQCAPILVRSPFNGELFDSAPVQFQATLIPGLDPATVAVELDGVDLITALALTPPFAGASGVVAVGPNNVTITNFNFDTSVNPVVVEFDAMGFPAGAYSFTVNGNRTLSGDFEERTVGFTSVLPFAQVLDGLPGAARAFKNSQPGLQVVNQSLGGPLASAPVSDATNEVRSGFVEAAEGFIRAAP